MSNEVPGVNEIRLTRLPTSVLGSPRNWPESGASKVEARGVVLTAGLQDVEPLEVLLHDVRVRADIDDVDPIDGIVVLQAFDGLRDHATRHHALAETGFVGNEETDARPGCPRRSGDPRDRPSLAGTASDS